MGCFLHLRGCALILDLLGQVFGIAVGDAAASRVVRRRIARLQSEGILVGALRGVDADLGRFGREWLSSEWHVSPGRVHVGSTTVVVESIDDAVRTGAAGDFMLPAGLDAVVLTVRGPGPVVEVAMPADSEAWFRAAVAKPVN